MFTIPYIETREEFFYLDVFLKLLLGLLVLLWLSISLVGQLSAYFRHGSGTELRTGGYHRGGDL